MTPQGLEFYSTLAADVANVLGTGYAWKLLAALPEPWEASATAQRLEHAVAGRVLCGVASQKQGMTCPQLSGAPQYVPQDHLPRYPHPPVRLQILFHFSYPTLFIPPSGTFLWQEQKTRCGSSMLLPFVPRVAGAR